MQNTFFTADYHFDHDNIIKFSKRPFRNVSHMNAEIIARHNKKVKPHDFVWFLGDFTYSRSVEQAQQQLDALNGIKHLIIGNHDQTTVKLKGWASMSHYKELYLEKKPIILCHYAMRTWNKSFHGSYMLYGHSHGSLPDDPNLLSFDVGVDCHNFEPIDFNEVKNIMSKKNVRGSQ